MCALFIANFYAQWLDNTFLKFVHTLSSAPPGAPFPLWAPGTFSTNFLDPSLQQMILSLLLLVTSYLATSLLARPIFSWWSRLWRVSTGSKPQAEASHEDLWNVLEVMQEGVLVRAQKFPPQPQDQQQCSGHHQGRPSCHYLWWKTPQRTMETGKSWRSPK